METNLKLRRALVTGASSGLGEAIARMLAGEGASVLVHGRDEARAGAVVDAIRTDGGSADVAIGDLSTDDGADRVLDQTLAAGQIDIL